MFEADPSGAAGALSARPWHNGFGTAALGWRSRDHRLCVTVLAALTLIAGVMGLFEEAAGPLSAILASLSTVAYLFALNGPQQRSLMRCEGLIALIVAAGVALILLAASEGLWWSIVSGVSLMAALGLLAASITPGGIQGLIAARAAQHAMLIAICADPDSLPVRRERIAASIDPRGMSRGRLRQAVAEALRDRPAAAILVDRDEFDADTFDTVSLAIDAFDVRILVPATVSAAGRDARLRVARDLRQAPLARLGKRSLDITVAAAALLLLAPLITIIAALIVIESGRPVFFQQIREGRNLSTFKIMKFRTMRASESDPAANRLTTFGDPRVTRVGAFLRRVSLDELPQLVNVLRGEMSLVGPRPLPPRFHLNGMVFEEALPDYALRSRMLPGITGLAQLEGLRGTPDDALKALEMISRRVDRDNAYIEDWSLLVDLRILVMTILSGAFASGY